MAYYHNLITKQSWQVLKSLKKQYNFTLIGGWAVWLYTKGLKSKDIDIVVDYKVLEKTRKEYDFTKNDRLKKYEFRVDDISVDVYVPFYSDLGIPVENILKNSQNIKGFFVPVPELLLVLKQFAYRGRRLSIKGRKDMIDIISLVRLDQFDWQAYFALLKKYRIRKISDDLVRIIMSNKEFEEIELNTHQYSRLKKKLMGLISPYV